jgi:hypothetical protein
MSEWKEESAKRRDFRSSKDGPESTGSKKRKKNKKKWCKGKVGEEHEFERHEHKHSILARAYLLMKCKKCGREEWARIVK